MVLSNTDLIVGKLQTELLNTAFDSIPASETVTDRNITSETEIFGLEDLVCRGVVQDSFGVNTGLMGESTVTTGYMKMISIALRAKGGTNVMGFMKGTLTSTASATKFSISRSMARLYLLLTYSGFEA